MRRLILGVGAIILSLAYFAEPGVAQDVNDLAGSWEFTVEAPQGGGGGRGGGGGGRRGGGPGGPFGGPQTLMLSGEGEMLEGALEGQGGSIELKNLVLEGGKITFTVEPAKYVGLRKIEPLQPAIQRRPQPFR